FGFNVLSRVRNLFYGCGFWYPVARKKLQGTSKNCFFGVGLRIEKSSFTVSKLRLVDLIRLEKSNF
ncbi:MAG: hypothetical protein RSF93_07575, partial [Mucinivorans sp.]